MNAHSLLAELGQQMNLPNLSFDNRGLSRLVFDRKIVVDLEHDEAGKVLHIYSVLGQIPPTNREKLFEMLLSANLFGKETGGASAAIDSLTGDILICRSLALDKTDSVDFQKILENFLDAAEKLMDRVKTTGAAVETAPLITFDPLSQSLLRA